MTDPLVERLGALDLALWEQITANAPLFMRAPFLLALEDHAIARAVPLYAIVRRDDRVIAALAGQRIHIEVERAARPGELGSLARAALEHIDLEVALWGNFLTWSHSGVALAPGVDPTEGWPIVAEFVYRAMKDDPAAKVADLHLVLDVRSEAVEHARALEAHGFSSYDTQPDMVLALDPAWARFDDYLGALNTKYRKASLDMDRALAKAGCRLARLDGPEIERRADELHRLYLEVHERSPHRFVTLAPGSIPALARRLGDAMRLNVVMQDDRLLGFGTTLFDGEDAIAYFVGHDEAANREVPIYLRLLQVAIADGLERRCRRVRYGRTALEPKARLGARAEPLTVFGRHRNRVVGALAGGVMQALTPQEAPPGRNPFRGA